MFVCVCVCVRERSAYRKWINNRKTFLCLYPQHPRICIASCSVCVCVCVCVCVEKTVVLFCLALFSYLADPRLSEPAGSLPNTSSVFCVAQSHTRPQCGRACFSSGWEGRRTKSGLAVSVCLVVCVCMRWFFSCLENGTSPPHLQGDSG